MSDLIEEICIGDAVEIFHVDDNGDEHQVLPGILVAIFRSNWNGNLLCIVEHVGNEHVIKHAPRKNVRRLTP